MRTEGPGIGPVRRLGTERTPVSGGECVVKEDVQSCAGSSQLRSSLAEHPQDVVRQAL